MKRITAIVLALTFAMLAGIATAQTVNRFRITSDSTGAYSSNIRSAPTWVDARVLASSTSETHTVPTGAAYVLFSADCNFYAKPGASAAVPASDVTDGTGSEQNPAAWQLTGVTQITLIAASACKVTMSFYQ